MLDLISFEIKKLFKFQKVLFGILILLIVNLFSINYQQTSQYIDPANYNKLYEEKLASYQDLSQEEYETQFDKDYKEVQIVNSFSQDNLSSSLYDYLIEEYSINDPELLKRFLNDEIDIDIETARILSLVLADLNDEKLMIDNYKNNVETVIEQSSMMSSISIFQDSDKSMSNIAKTAHDYGNIQNVTPILDNHIAAKSFLNERYTFIFIFILVLIGVFSLSIKEKNSGMDTLIATTIKGSKETVIAKLCALILFSFIICFIFYISNIIYLQMIYGFNGLLDPVQSLYGFENITLRLNCLEAMTLEVFYVFLCITICSLLVFVLAYIINNSVIVGLIVLSVMIVEGLLYYTIPITSVLGILRYLNIFTIFNLKFTLYQYHNIVLFNMAFGLKETIVIMLGIILIIALILLLTIKPLDLKNKLKIKFKIHLPSSHTFIFLHELKRSLIQNKGLLILVLFGIYLIGTIDAYQDPVKNVSYEELIKEYGGKIDDEKISIIKEYRVKIDRMDQDLYKLKEDYKNGIIDDNTYYTENSRLSYELSKAQSLDILENSIENARGNNRGLVFDDGFAMLFDKKINNERLNGVMINYFVIIIVVIALISPLFTVDSLKGCDKFYETTINNNKRILTKQLVMVFYCAVIALLLGVWKYYAIGSYYDLSFGEYGFGSVMELSDLFNFDLPLNTGYILVCFIRFIVLLCVGEIVLFLSKITHSTSNCIILSAVIILLPNLLIFSNFSGIKNFLFISYFINSNSYILDTVFFIKMIMMILIIVILGILNSKISLSKIR